MGAAGHRVRLSGIDFISPSQVRAMSEGVLVALISGGVSLLGVILSGWMSGRKQAQALRIAQAITDTKIEALTREVREHNDFARRMPVVEEQIKTVTGELRELRRYHTQIH